MWKSSSMAVLMKKHRTNKPLKSKKLKKAIQNSESGKMSISTRNKKFPTPKEVTIESMTAPLFNYDKSAEKPVDFSTHGPSDFQVDSNHSQFKYEDKENFNSINMQYPSTQKHQGVDYYKRYVELKKENQLMQDKVAALESDKQSWKARFKILKTDYKKAVRRIDKFLN